MAEELSTMKIDKGPRFGMRHIQTLLLFLNIVVVYVGRLSISVAVVAMTNAESTNPDFPEFDWTTLEKSYIISSFYWGYIITQFPSGNLCRRFGARRLMFVCTLACAILNLLTPILVEWGDWQAYCVIRVMQGLFQGVVFPAISEHIANWSPPDERNTIGSVTYSGTDCGTVLAMLVSGLIASGPLGWPGISYISGGLCFVWCVFWYILGANNPPSSRFITKEECQYIEASLKRKEDFHEKKIPIPWWAMLTSMPFIAVIISSSAEKWGFSTMQTQIPSYLNGVFDMNIVSNSLFSTIPYVARWIMSYVFMVLGNMSVNRGWLSLTAMRKIANTLALWVAALFMICIGFFEDANEALVITLMTLNVGFHAGTTMGCVLNGLDLSPNHAGVTMSIVNALANLTPLVTPLVAGEVVSDTSNRYQWQIVFIISAAVFFIGNLIFIIFGTAKVQPWDEPDYLSKDNIEEANEKAPKSLK